MIPTPLHAALDAVSAAALIAGPRARGWPKGLRGPFAAAGLGVAGYSLLTRYRQGSAAPLSMGEHLALDALQGAGFCAAAALLDRAPREVRTTMLGYGLFSLAAALLTDRPEQGRRTVGRQVAVPSEARASIGEGPAHEVVPGLAYRRLGIVNLAFLGARGAGDRGWVLVDAGLPVSAGAITRAAEARFGPGARPAAIVMTHGHFDHVGALEHLAEAWDVPVYAHPLEHSYLDGTASYPPGDPTVGGGAMAAVAGLYPTAPVDVSRRLRALPEDGTVPFAPDWRWLHTPGHTPGHVSLWREGDRTLLSGDAVITTRQEAAYAVALQSPEIHGPPAYFTPDWAAARASARTLAALEPEVILSGHGAPLGGPEMRRALHRLADAFDALAVPDARDRSLPPDRSEGRA
ncbi:MBL fold metallo-hydrolase [Jannaschia formosa]|uniref:MBL fold metallo-hydrolase n=1 Tax=Jannaschia formosa TaxID=2259592 RepID=UPI000E1C1AD0|nr:MBL fold metallo-hydrolase [Jannaschia formosa]TFL19040.1 MBL fold metallo-hydrolase [Jannaschia formosa]